MQDGLFRYKCMPMGVLSALGWFQHIMNAVIAASGVNGASVFLDDCNIKGLQSKWEKCWKDTLQVLKTLASFGFMVNLRKCKFLMDKVAMLGLELNAVGFALGLKLLGNLHKVQIPTNLCELQGLVGKLMYASPHIPHFKERVKPIEALLAQRGEVKWTEACTVALNDLLSCMYA